jgi:hypothetical protein
VGAHLTTRLFERDWRAAAPDISRLYDDDVRTRGAEGASVSARVGRQIAGRWRAAEP